MKKILSLLAASVFLSLPICAANLGELFLKAKEEVKAAKWNEALKTFDALDTESQAPGAEAQRKQLEPVLAFYRGVCFANLDRAAEAQSQFESYLAPTQRLGPGIPKKWRSSREGAPDVFPGRAGPAAGLSQPSTATST